MLIELISDPEPKQELNIMLLTLRTRFADLICPEMKTRRNELERALNVDELTGLANRRAFAAARETAEADENISIIVFDANNFKLINKAFSHAEGDKFIKKIAETIHRVCLRFGNDRAFRLHSGDEFAVIAPRRIAAQLRNEIEREFGVYDFKTFKVSISGEIGSTVDEADSKLQARKREAKKVQSKELSTI